MRFEPFEVEVVGLCVETLFFEFNAVPNLRYMSESEILMSAFRP